MQRNGVHTYKEYIVVDVNMIHTYHKMRHVVETRRVPFEGEIINVYDVFEI